MSRLALLPLLFAACLVSGQVQQTFIYSGMSFPATCPTTNRLFILTPTGDIYSCPVAQGPWVLKASGSVSGVVLLNPPADQTIVSSAQQSLILSNTTTGSIHFNPNDPVFDVPTFILDSKAGTTLWGFYFNGTPEFFIDTNIDSSLPGNPTELSFSEQKTLTDDMQLVNGDTYIGGNLSLGTLSEGSGQAGKGNLTSTGYVNIGAGKTYQVNGTQIGCGNLLGAGSLCSSSATLPANTPAVTHDFFTAYNSGTGAFSVAQPACGDLSDSVASCNTLPIKMLTTQFGANVALTGTQYANVSGFLDDVASTIASFRSMIVGSNMTVTAVYANTLANEGAAATLTFTLCICTSTTCAAVNTTAATCTIGNNSSSCNTTGLSVSVTAGQQIVWQTIQTGVGTATFETVALAYK